ncbi:DUF2812 domain-containing protein [Bacillus sinesaloumensis]|uniref:DUF2812 domain-containing protein n=1 Tax=Litchfieldia sinesaloumensis TaxID=1926280 RepID=UPI0009883771|nr:DUF2812 domain-containing protein [Bacillus sinesaloumensis]
MNKTVRKVRPSDYWRIGEHESWFADMASQGLHLKKMGKIFAYFEKGEPQKMRYRIDVSMKSKMQPEQIEIYAESGWDYVTGYQGFHVFSSPVERDAPEIHTDPAEQSFTLKELDKKLMLNAGFIVVALLLIIGMLSSLWFLDGTPVYMLVDGAAVTQTILTIVIGYQAYNSLLAAISIRALQKSLIEGKPINHHAPWKKRHRIQSTSAILFMIVAGLTAIVPFTQLVIMDTKTLPHESPDLPIVRLADIETNPALERGESEYIRDGVDWSNRISTKWSPFAPVQYESDENGMVPGEILQSIQTKYFQLSIPALADRLISELVKRHNYADRVDDYVETKHPEFDRLIILEEKEMKEVYASKGKEVIFVRYYGNANVDLIIESIVERLEH